MKWFKYSQWIYLIAAIIFSISTIYKFSIGQSYVLQLFIAIMMLVMFFVRRAFLKRIEKK